MTKHDLRKQFKERRQALTALAMAEQSEAIAQRCLDFFDVGKMTAIHSYLPISQQNEVNTFAILNSIESQYPQTQIVVPKVVPNSSDLEHSLWKSDTKLSRNKWNILEPSLISNRYGEPFQYSILNIQLVIIPLLVYDKSGHRVGYGKGYYDRFLAQCSPDTIKVGLSFFEPVEAIEDIDPHDVQLNYCITPTKIWSF